MSQNWNDPEFQADIARDAMQADRKIEDLEVENARFRKALEEIARIRRGLDFGDTDEYRADYFFRQVDCYQDLARKALRGPSPA